MRSFSIRTLRVLSLGLLSLGVCIADSQQTTAQVVQLPVVRQFGVTTTVMVPDGGAAHMGGIRSAREGRVSRGNPLLPGRLGSNRAIGRDYSTADAWATVRIMDMKELDRMTLLAATPDEIEFLSEKAKEITKTVRKSNITGAGASSLAELRAARAAVESAAVAEIQKQLQKADEFEKRGRLGTAKIYYRIAYRDGDPATRKRALAALRRLSTGENAAKTRTANRVSAEVPKD